jgi:hypothetical protein
VTSWVASGAAVGRPGDLITLRDRLDERFIVGVVFHTGRRTFELARRILAIPIAALWGR